ncbi:hypothetical protein [Sediminihaliea albiluteola]|uniref:hypothetical protein n=1 Tax=Sediminihaliea albiluteola TaxID=2758564 RepID=UPI001C70F7CF|nr:hypothetical protein [Sediminihaliea albiluteola]
MATLTKALSTIALSVMVGGLLSACAPLSPQDAGYGAAQPAEAGSGADTNAEQKVPELTLNLPANRHYQCVAPEAAPDYTFLERGYMALAQNDYIEAVQHFQRYQRLESSPESDWESGIAIAYISMLPSSPFFDAEAARKTYRQLNKQLNPQMQVHEKSLLMRQSLETFVILDRHIADLEASNSTLKDDLHKREEALKRLRELTLGQRAGRQ